VALEALLGQAQPAELGHKSNFYARQQFLCLQTAALAAVEGHQL
jgi:hypothetical protein